MDEPLGVFSTGSANVRGERAATEPVIRTSTNGTFDLWAACILTLAQLIFSGAVTYGALLSTFAYDGCGSPQPECNYALGGFALRLVPVTCVLIFALTVAVIVARYRRARPTWWIPVAGAGVSVTALVVSILLTVLATARPPW